MAWCMKCVCEVGTWHGWPTIFEIHKSWPSLFMLEGKFNIWLMTTSFTNNIKQCVIDNVITQKIKLDMILKLMLKLIEDRVYM